VRDDNLSDQLSPAAWLQRLEKRLNDRWFMRMGICDAYFEGDHQLAFATAKFREAFGSLFATVADNWCPIVVDAKAERLVVQGFRFGASTDADKDAWSIWQANNLDAESDMVHTEAIKLGEAYWLVEPGTTSSDPPRITSEHPSQMIVATAPGDRKKRLAALKKWVDEDGFAYANLYLPDLIVKWQSAGKLGRGGGGTGGKINWTRRQDDPGGANPLGEVPVVPVRNNPSMIGGGRSDIWPIIDLQNAVNKLLSDMLIGSEYQAFPQRVLLGVEIPRDENGQPIRAAEMKASQSRLWVFANEKASVKEFSAADLDNYVKASKHLVAHLTAQTRTPPHYVLGEIVNASGDALKAAETGLVKKTTRTMSPFGEGHEEAMRLAFKSRDRSDPRAQATDAETIWRDPETRSQAELADSLVKLAGIGVPQEVLWERYGFSPQEIERMKTIQETETLLQAIAPARESLRITEAAPTVPLEKPGAPPSAAPPNGQPRVPASAGQ
jgi:hypothetical protein